MNSVRGDYTNYLLRKLKTRAESSVLRSPGKFLNQISRSTAKLRSLERGCWESFVYNCCLVKLQGWQRKFFLNSTALMSGEKYMRDWIRNKAGISDFMCARKLHDHSPTCFQVIEPCNQYTPLHIRKIFLTYKKYFPKAEPNFPSPHERSFLLPTLFHCDTDCRQFLSLPALLVYDDIANFSARLVDAEIEK